MSLGSFINHDGGDVGGNTWGGLYPKAVVFFTSMNSLFSSAHPVSLFLALKGGLGEESLLEKCTSLLNVLGTFFSL